MLIRSRWLFIIEGAATVVVALATAFIIPDWPATTKWLSEDEKALAVTRLIEDAGEEEEGEIRQLQALKMAATDYRVWLCILGQLSVQAVASLTNFLPTLVRNFGFSTIHTLLLTAPVSFVT
jgi:type II secretory pathway pseudopilin PulG